MGRALPTSAVVICAYHSARWDVLQLSLASVRTQTAPPDEVILVIDHNDELLQRAREYCDATVVGNAWARGASGARNTGADIASADILVFLDDDAAAGQSSWLETLLTWYANPSVVAVGGPADPVWEGGRAPAWFPSSFLWTVGCTYEGQPTVAQNVRNLWACNMSIRRSVFAAIGGFRTEIGGVHRNVTLGCEETELCIRAGRVGDIVYDPTARVTHSVGVGRQSWAYFRRRCWSEGVSKAQVIDILPADSAKALAVESNYITRILTRAWLKSIRGAARGRPGAFGEMAAIPAGAGLTMVAYCSKRVLQLGAGVARRKKGRA